MPPDRIGARVRSNRAASPTLDLVRTALLAAACTALGYAMVGVPNVELISAAVFACGAVTGVRRGAAIGAVAEALFAGLNPMGVSPPPLYVTQVLAFAALGAAGGAARPLVARGPHAVRIAAAAACGFLATVLYDAATGVAVWVTVREQASLVATVLGSLTFPFPLAHALANAVAFAVLVPAVVKALRP
jgi:hypothetical protein